MKSSQFVMVPKFQLRLMGWGLAFLMFFKFLESSAASSTGLAILDAVLIIFWLWWTESLIKRGKIDKIVQLEK